MKEIERRVGSLFKELREKTYHLRLEKKIGNVELKTRKHDHPNRKRYRAEEERDRDAKRKVRGVGPSKSTGGKAQPPTPCEEDRVIPDVPFVKTPEPVARRMLELSNLKSGEMSCDLGFGDGRFLIIAARDFDPKAFGVEGRNILSKRFE